MLQDKLRRVTSTSIEKFLNFEDRGVAASSKPLSKGTLTCLWYFASEGKKHYVENSKSENKVAVQRVNTFVTLDK